MQIAETIKKLRREREMTQEQLAEYLGISTQAVSRWETGLSLPDIALLPALSNVLDVTSDTLLGIDITAKEAKIQAIIDDAWENHTSRGHQQEAVDILRAGLREYPNSYKLIAQLSWTLWVVAQDIPKSDEDEEFKAALAEPVALAEKVLAECTDDVTRHMLTQVLCPAYRNLGEKDKAVALAKTMPNKLLSQEALLGTIYEGTELYRHRQYQIEADMMDMTRRIANLNLPLDDGSRPYTLDERIALQHKALAIYDIMIEDGNFGYFHQEIAEIHVKLASLGTEAGDTAAALEHLRLAAKHVIAFDKDIKYRAKYEPDEDKTYTCLVLRGGHYGHVTFTTPYNGSQELLNDMEKPGFDALRDTPEFAAVAEELRKHAAAW